MDLSDIYRTFHPKTTEYTFCSIAHGIFSRVDHILGHESNLGKFKACMKWMTNKNLLYKKINKIKKLKKKKITNKL